MNEKPILFSGPMVQAILAGVKSQTRRVIKPEWSRCLDLEDEDDQEKALQQCPYVRLGSFLWVRETWYQTTNKDFTPGQVIYKADGWEHADGSKMYWRPSIHMPRSASRIDLKITAVWIEHLQDITKANARDEGMSCAFNGGTYDFSIGPYDAYTANFRRLWDAINAKRGYGWDVNPWVWVIRFMKIRP